MEFGEYQVQCIQTDRQNKKSQGEQGLLIPLLGLAGETGTLLAEYKKKVRDGQIYEKFDERAEEELGDILWYLSNVASRLGLSLDKIARRNLLKTQERWPIEIKKGRRKVFDAEFPASERLPRKVVIRVYEDPLQKVARMEMEGSQCIIVGDKLTDNSYENDGYRFHDVFHLAYWAVLGWSPIMRKLLSCKRKSRPEIDEIEDGARAGIIEELIVAFVYTNARNYKFYEGARHLDSEMLSTIKRLVMHLEVRERPTSDWEKAIIQGYRAFRHARKHGEVRLMLDMDRKSLKVLV